MDKGCLCESNSFNHFHMKILLNEQYKYIIMYTAKFHVVTVL